MIQFLRLQKKKFFKIIFWMKVKNNIKMILKKLQKIFLKLMKLKVKINMTVIKIKMQLDLLIKTN